jgi:hypothetical protein
VFSFLQVLGCFRSRVATAQRREGDQKAEVRYPDANPRTQRQELSAGRKMTDLIAFRDRESVNGKPHPKSQ